MHRESKSLEVKYLNRHVKLVEINHK